MGRVCWLLIFCLALLFCLAGCAEKHHPPEVDTGWIRAMAVVVAQEAGQPLSLTLVESEVTRHLYHQFRLVMPSQLAAALGEYPLTRATFFDPETYGKIVTRTGVNAVLEVIVTGHEITFSRAGEHRAQVALSMQLFELPSGVVRWSRSTRRTRGSDTVSAAVHEAVSGAVWDCLKHLTGWDAIVKQDSLVRVCSRTGLSLDSTAESAADGLEVKQVASGSVWQQAGLRRGDIIARVNGRSLDCATVEWPGRGRPKEISLTVKRGDDLVELTVPLGNEALLPPAADRQERSSRNVR